MHVRLPSDDCCPPLTQVFNTTQMAIEPLQHVTLLAPRREVEDLTDWLQELSVLHVEDAAGPAEGDDGEAAGLEKPAVSTDEVDTRIRELRSILEVFGFFDLMKSSFVEMVVALPKRVSVEERRDVVADFDYAPVHREVSRLQDEYHRHLAAVERARDEYARLEFFRLLPFGPEDIHSLGRCRVWVGSMTDEKWEALRSSDEVGELMGVAELRRRKRTVDVCVVALKDDAEEAGRLLRTHQLEELPLPQYEGSRTDRMDELTAEIGRRHKQAEHCKDSIKKFAGEARKVEILLGYWEGERAKMQARSGTVNSKRIAMLSGFIRRRDVEGFKERLAERFPFVSGVYREPRPDDEVPVEITNARCLKPLRFLVDLFGRPDYFSFDPTPYLALSFLIFFGMCFGDVVYGSALALLGYLLARKARPYESLHNLCMMFCYAGISTMFIGALMGSWASDLWRPEYLGEGNLLYRIRQYLAVVDPLDRAALLLVVSIGIGVINQFYGIILKGYSLLRRGLIWDAVFDAGLWFLVLPGFLIAFGSLFFNIPPWLLRSGLVLLVAGGIGLILTQGREAEGIAAKVGTGLISIYGIMGSYGCVSFLSDILSYSRLIALGLTTAIVGMSFNIIAGLVRETPAVGIVLFAVVLILGHTFNFMVSMLAAFVHPARLIFLEFFNRFYQPGGSKFSPLSLSTESVIVEAEGD